LGAIPPWYHFVFQDCDSVFIICLIRSIRIVFTIGLVLSILNFITPGKLTIMYRCVRGIESSSVSVIFLLDFGIVLMVLYYLFFKLPLAFKMGRK